MWKQPHEFSELEPPVEELHGPVQVRTAYADAEAVWLLVDDESLEDEDELLEELDEDAAEPSEEALELEVSAELELERESVR